MAKVRTAPLALSPALPTACACDGSVGRSQTLGVHKSTSSSLAWEDLMESVLGSLLSVVSMACHSRAGAACSCKSKRIVSKHTHTLAAAERGAPAGKHTITCMFSMFQFQHLSSTFATVAPLHPPAAPSRFAALPALGELLRDDHA